METPEIHCPKCGSTQINVNRKGFSGGKAVVGAVLTGGIGLLAGTIGSKDLLMTCLNCGKQFKPGEGKSYSGEIPQNTGNQQKENAQAKQEALESDPAYQEKMLKRRKINMVTFSVIFSLLGVILLASASYVWGGICLALAALFVTQYFKNKSLLEAFLIDKGSWDFQKMSNKPDTKEPYQQNEKPY